MDSRHGLILALGVSAFAGACASAGTTVEGGAEGMAAASLPALSCPAGVTLAETEYTEAAQQSLARTLIAGEATAQQPLYQEALDQSLAGIQADPNNPQSFFLAGQAYVGLGDYVGADSVFTRAETLCPAFSAEIDPLREQTWATVFNQGVEAYQQQDAATAISRWEQAALIDPDQPETYLNLGVAYAEQNQTPQALENYRRVLALTESTQDTAVLDTRRNAIAAISSVGGALFQANDFAGSAGVFQTLTEVEPRSREAWNNYAISLYRQDNWQELIPAAQRLIEIDPLNRNANVFLFQAYKGLQQNEQGLTVLERIEAMPVYVDNLQLQSAAGRSTVTGSVEGNAAAAGTPVQLRFTFFGPSGELGTQTVSVPAPAKGANAQFEAVLENPTPVSAYNYVLVQ